MTTINNPCANIFNPIYRNNKMSTYNLSYVKDYIKANFGKLRGLAKFAGAASEDEVLELMHLDANAISAIKNRYPIVPVAPGNFYVNSASTRHFAKNCYNIFISKFDYFEFNIGIEACDSSRCGTLCTSSCYDIDHRNPFNDNNFGVSCSSQFQGVTYFDVPRLIVLRNRRALNFMNIGLGGFEDRMKFSRHMAKIVLGDDYKYDIYTPDPRFPEDTSLHERFVWYIFEEAADRSAIDGIIQVDEPFEPSFNRPIFGAEWQIFRAERDLYVNCVMHDFKVYYNIEDWRVKINELINERKDTLMGALQDPAKITFCYPKLTKAYDYAYYTKLTGALDKICKDQRFYVYSNSDFIRDDNRLVIQI